jgi:ATP-dependent DNA helicase RecG
VPLGSLSGVGPARAKAMSALGISSLADLLSYYPRRYLDRTRLASLSELKLGEEAWLVVRVRRVRSRRARTGRSVVEVDCSDGRGYLKVTFFNQPWRAQQLKEGQQVAVFGRLDRYQGRAQMVNPVVDLVGDRTGRIVPLYPASEKAQVSTWQVAELVEKALEAVGELADPLAAAERRDVGLVGRSEALRMVHSPQSMEEKEQGRRRLAFDELLWLQLALLAAKRRSLREEAGICHDTRLGEGSLVAELFGRLGFRPTKAQLRAIEEIALDMASPHPMHRLLQGDVGSGKTLVAAAAMLFAVQGGHQACLLAPTEVLAEQHFQGLSRLLSGMEVPSEATLEGTRPLRIALLVGRLRSTERRLVTERLASGELDLVVGTHALLSEGVEFASLGAVVVDEQHRFGVEQRAHLRQRVRRDGLVPDTLVMTATPIPRTVAMTYYGDLELSVLDELPLGRRPVETTWLRGIRSWQRAWEAVRREVAEGHRCYVICPLVEESGALEASSATAEFERLSEGELAGLRLGLVHGQMASSRREETMAAFRSGEVDVLVATTVVEVGVDVPEATVIVIEDADRFGIAQLHQLRGRVGRSSLPSWCFLLSKEEITPEAEARLRAVEATTDGFRLAEEDLRLRGEGTVLGTRQQGRSDLKAASLVRDVDLVGEARQLATQILEADPRLSSRRLLAEEVSYFVGAGAEFLLKG